MIFVTYMHYELCEQEKKYQTEHRLGLTLLKQVLEDKYGIWIDGRMEDAVATDGCGKPYLPAHPNIQFNISHCDGWIVCGVSSQPIGVDVERCNAFSNAMKKKVLTEQELCDLEKGEALEQTANETFCKYWTLKESYLKWLGKGFAVDPKTVEFKQDCEAVNGIRCSDERVACAQKRLATDCFISVCYEKDEEEITYESYEEKMARFNCQLSD